MWPVTRCPWITPASRCSRRRPNSAFKRRRRPVAPSESAQREGALLADVQPQIQRDLIVARARRVEHAGGFAERAGEQRLDGHVDVFFVGKVGRHARERAEAGATEAAPAAAVPGRRPGRGA